MGWKTGRRVQHLKPQPSDSPRSPPVLCRAWWWQAVEGSEPAVCVAPRAPSLCLRVCTRGLVRRAIPPPSAHLPCSVVPWTAPASGGMWMWCVWASPAACGRAWCFGDGTAGTVNDDVLFPSQFPPFPAHQDGLLVGRQGRAVPGCCNPGLQTVLVWHAWGSTLGAVNLHVLIIAART